MGGRHRPSGDYFPDARRPRHALADLEQYIGLIVDITYRPMSRRVQDRHTILRGKVVRTKSGPPSIILELQTGKHFELMLDRIASLTIVHS